MVDFSGTAELVKYAFGTEIHRLDVAGVPHIANMSDPQIPAALAPLVAGVVSLHDFRPHTNYKPRPQYTFTSSGSTLHALVPADLATIYNLNPLFTAGIEGQGQTIVLIEDTNVHSTADVSTFRSTFGLPTASFTQVQPGGCTNPGDVAGNDGEATLDVEWAGAAAPAAALELASCADTATTFGGLIAIQNLINGASPPAIMSVSYGECEAENGAAANAAYISTYQQAAAEGVSIFVSSGDEGAASCDADQSKSTHGIGVSGFASTPYNVAVGGTDFSDTYAGTTGSYWNTTNGASFGSAKSYIPEIPWNDSCASQLLASYEGSSTTYGSSGFCNSLTGIEDFETTASGSGGRQRLRQRHRLHPAWSAAVARGTPKPSLAVGLVRQSQRRCAGFAGRVAVRRQRRVGPLLRLLLLRQQRRRRRRLHRSSQRLVRRGRHLLLIADHGGHPGAGEPEDRRARRQPRSGVLVTSWPRPRVRQRRQQQLQFQQRGSGAGSACLFYDVTQGDMDVNCTGTHNCYRPSGTNGVLSTSTSAYDPAYGTATGWDFATGIGTVNAANLVNGWPGAGTANYSLAASPASVSESQGGSTTSTITVTPLNGFSGSVSLAASGLPAGVTASFSPASTTSTSTLTLAASSTATTGTSTVTMTEHLRQPDADHHGEPDGERGCPGELHAVRIAGQRDREPGRERDQHHYR